MDLFIIQRHYYTYMDHYAAADGAIFLVATNYRRYWGTYYYYYNDACSDKILYNQVINREKIFNKHPGFDGIYHSFDTTNVTGCFL